MENKIFDLQKQVEEKTGLSYFALELLVAIINASRVENIEAAAE
jgi:hypothetical protein